MILHELTQAVRQAIHCSQNDAVAAVAAVLTVLKQEIAATEGMSIFDDIPKDFRWLVEIDYRTDHGPSTVDHHIEELSELHDLVENGPDWNTIDQIRIVLNPERRNHTVTAEEARKR